MKLKIVFIFMLFSMFFGCKSAKNIEVSTENNTKIVEKEVFKYVKDSIFVEKTDTFRQFFKGDTVVLEQIKWRNLVKYQIKSDTLRLKDSVFVDKVKIKKETVIEIIPFWKKFWFGLLIGVSSCVLLIILAGRISQIIDNKNELSK